MSLKQNKPGLIGPALIGACLAVVASVPLAAYVGSLFGDTYQARALTYCGLLLWAVIGAISIFFITKDAEQQSLEFKFILLWLVSAWLWPLLVVTWLIKRKRQN